MKPSMASFRGLSGKMAKRSDGDAEILIQLLQCKAADFSVPEFLIFSDLLQHLFVELRQQVEGDVCGLIMRWVCVRDVVAEASERGFTRVGPGSELCRVLGCVLSGSEASSDALYVAFNA